MATKYKTVTDDVNLRYWEDGAYFQAWYPVCLATDLEPGKIKGIEFLNSRIIAYRDGEGRAIVQTAYCPHLGAELSQGELIDGEVRCPYHHWRFDSKGTCTHVPTIGKPLRSARIMNYPVAERWGLIWVFNGEEPRGEVPTLIDVTEEDVIYRTYDMGEHNVESWIPITNALDFAHVVTVHNFPHTADGSNYRINPHSLRFDFPVLYPDGGGEVFYHNTFSMRNMQPFAPGNYTMPTSNTPRPGWYHQFAVLAVDKPADEAGMELAEQTLDALYAMLQQLNREDEAILGAIRFRPRGEAKLVKADKGLGMLLDYFDALPRAAPLD